MDDASALVMLFMVVGGGAIYFSAQKLQKRAKTGVIEDWTDWQLLNILLMSAAAFYIGDDILRDPGKSHVRAALLIYLVVAATANGLPSLQFGKHRSWKDIAVAAALAALWGYVLYALTSTSVPD